MKLPSHGRYDYVPITRRADYAWPREAQLTLLNALAQRLQRGRVPAKG